MNENETINEIRRNLDGIGYIIVINTILIFAIMIKLIFETR